jgi:hypothetical protein
VRTSPMVVIAGAALAMASITATAHADTIPPKSELVVYAGADTDSVCGPKPAGQPKVTCVVRAADAKGAGPADRGPWGAPQAGSNTPKGWWWIGDFDEIPKIPAKGGY